MDQGCPLSPALFAIGIADCLDSINSRLQELSTDAKLFSYLDDIIVIVPNTKAAEAKALVLEELHQLGLEVNGDKTVAWSRDPNVALPESIEAHRKPTFRCLGACAPWLDSTDPLGRLPVHAFADGEEAVQEATRFRERLKQLGEAGLRAKTALQLLQTCSAGCVTHLLRANHESGNWLDRLDAIWLGIVEDFTGNPLGESQRKHFIRK